MRCELRSEYYVLNKSKILPIDYLKEYKKIYKNKYKLKLIREWIDNALMLVGTVKREYRYVFSKHY